MINLWRDRIRFKGGRVVYDEFDLSDLKSHEYPKTWTNRLGNQERPENLIWARDHCRGYFRVIVIVAKDTSANPREIAECYPHERLQMRITEPDEQTGQFRAEQAIE